MPKFVVVWLAISRRFGIRQIVGRQLELAAVLKRRINENVTLLGNIGCYGAGAVCQLEHKELDRLRLAFALTTLLWRMPMQTVLCWFGL